MFWDRHWLKTQELEFWGKLLLLETSGSSPPPYGSQAVPITDSLCWMYSCRTQASVHWLLNMLNGWDRTGRELLVNSLIIMGGSRYVYWCWPWKFRWRNDLKKYCKMWGWGREKAVELDIGQQKARNRRIRDSEGALCALPTPYFLSKFPAKSVCQCQEVPCIPIRSGGDSESSRMLTKGALMWEWGSNHSENLPGGYTAETSFTTGLIKLLHWLLGMHIQSPKAHHLEIPGCV